MVTVMVALRFRDHDVSDLNAVEVLLEWRFSKNGLGGVFR